MTIMRRENPGHTEKNYKRTYVHLLKRFSGTVNKLNKTTE